MSNAVITVANAAELMSALAAATGGETIRLQAGNYGDFGLWNVRDTFVNNYTSAVTITSANPDDLAVFTAVGLNGVKNLSFDAVKFDYTATAGDPDWARPFNIENSTGITIANSVFEGALDYTYSRPAPAPAMASPSLTHRTSPSTKTSSSIGPGQPYLAVSRI